MPQCYGATILSTSTITLILLQFLNMFTFSNISPFSSNLWMASLQSPALPLPSKKSHESPVPTIAALLNPGLLLPSHPLRGFNLANHLLPAAPAVYPLLVGHFQDHPHFHCYFHRKENNLTMSPYSHLLPFTIKLLTKAVCNCCLHFPLPFTHFSH